MESNIALYCFPLLFMVCEELVPFIAEGYIAFHDWLGFVRGLVPFVER
jgi:hypothetical protein